MAQRRSLSTAIQSVPNADPAAVREFVTQEKAKTHQSPSLDSLNQSEQLPFINSSTGAGDLRQNAATINPSSSQGTTLRRQMPPSFQPVGLIPITVRLRAEIAGALKRASLERQLAAADFFSQQEIVERALTSWLSENGHLDL